MQTFIYEARNAATGQKVKATVQADNERSAARLIQGQGLAPLAIELLKENSSRFKKVKVKDKVIFSRQLSTLINAGLPLVQSLRTVLNQTGNKNLKFIINQVISDVEAGQSFASSLEKHPNVFNPVFTSLIAAGEASGTLDNALDRLAVQQEKDAEVVSKIRGAMAYPIVVILVMAAVVGFMVVGVLPQVKTLYEGMSAGQMPLITRVLLMISDFIIKFWWIFLGIIGGLSVFGFRWLKTLGGQRFIDKFKLEAPAISRIYKKMYMARFARTASTLVASGVPLIEMLEITAEAINNVYIKESVYKSIAQVKGGKSLSESLMGDPYFLELVPNMLHIGEQSGTIENMMSKTAEYYEKEVDNEIKMISMIIEPALMIMLGVVALIIVAAVLLPIYGLAGKAVIN